jgi:hypothetical protein
MQYVSFNIALRSCTSTTAHFHTFTANSLPQCHGTRSQMTQLDSASLVGSIFMARHAATPDRPVCRSAPSTTLDELGPSVQQLLFHSLAAVDSKHEIDGITYCFCVPPRALSPDRFVGLLCRISPGIYRKKLRCSLSKLQADSSK